MKEKHTNSLIEENSPYLLQHAHNPVDWKPWGEAAFEQAREENKLVLVSIGYSACHWCHVMERETFEDEAVAAYMNKHFVSIKVDREERPDVDQVYMNAVQLMTQRGGWPLNCFTLADGRPIYGGTYFPKQDWLKVLESLVDIQKNEPGKIEAYAQKLTEGVQQSELIEKVSDQNPFTEEIIDTLVTKWASSWDMEEGGPMRAPKFPLPNNYRFLMHYATTKGDSATADFVKLTLDKMARGGIYDQIGGGFARYSVDGLWKVPHFEKMLYDNAQLVSLYSDAYARFDSPEYLEVVAQTLNFIDRELTSPEGLFYSALDADSEGEEGKFYIWSKKELKEILGADYNLLAKYFHVDSRGAWENGQYILLRTTSPAEFASSEGIDPKVWQETLEKAKTKLLEVRSSRERPGLDDKILCSWNALMIKGYVDAFGATGKKNYLARAQTAMQTLLDKMKNEDGGLHHSYKEGKAKINGYLEDYAFTIEALIALYEASFDKKWLEQALDFNSYVQEHFFDEKSGMFWFTSNSDPALIARKQEVMDNVIPASNSVMAKNLFLLGTLFAKDDLIQQSAQMLRNVQDYLEYGQNYSNWADLHLWHAAPFYEVAITGSREVEPLLQNWRARYLPNSVLVGGPKENLPVLEGKIQEEATIYVCFNKACQMPVYTVEDALGQMD